MARMRGPRFKKCRRLNLNVCGHPKAMKRAGNGQARDAKKLSPYGEQLLEKQRLRSYYEVMEKQFRRYVKAAKRSPALTGEKLIRDLECRLDNLVYRMNFASSIRQARQMVVHGHILINGLKVDIPSYAVAVGDQISLKPSARNVSLFKDNITNRIGYALPYIAYDPANFTATLLRDPQRDEIPIQINDHLVVEYYATMVTA
ncbi:MAG: small subunit ribosomal protein [Clostridiales bacterium]|nr:small subunit ribosomal protein [Clostridiales bacterium]